MMLLFWNAQMNELKTADLVLTYHYKCLTLQRYEVVTKILYLYDSRPQ